MTPQRRERRVTSDIAGRRELRHQTPARSEECTTTSPPHHLTSSSTNYFHQSLVLLNTAASKARARCGPGSNGVWQCVVTDHDHETCSSPSPSTHTRFRYSGEDVHWRLSQWLPAPQHGSNISTGLDHHTNTTAELCEWRREWGQVQEWLALPLSHSHTQWHQWWRPVRQQTSPNYKTLSSQIPSSAIRISSQRWGSHYIR